GDSGIMGTGGLGLTITTLAPTAALAEIRGGVRTAKGRPISGAYVTILNTNTNQTMTVRTGTFGNFRFEGLPVGSFYTMWVEHGRYQFGQPLQSFTLESDIGDATFISN
ncbi:MAG: carboxypeptidase-like regulatory domain-containing protein, partial [Acidobacteriota bacterium]|nr:carboxypeptidase-like regulatory domain-containing protein [Acidobacteriota bacterium]